MLISKVSEGNEAGGYDGQEISTEEDHTHEYQTASELFEIMAKDHNFDTNGDDPLTTRDLVILYKNIDLGTKLMTNANELKLKKPNQYVETIIYNEDPESDGSEINDIYSAEDLHNVFMANEERIDFFQNRPSLENTLCHKFGDIEIQSSELTTAYDKHFAFHDPYIKEQLNIYKLNSNEYDGTTLPASLLDYICCKRLEDNYNFYMDNIIRYVKHTIEQLKRISNGDYLTDKAKQKWKEVKHASEMHDTIHNKTKVLATSISIPLHVEQKTNGLASTWDDIVHSEVDVRSLSKIIEKKIVVEVPKLICGSYKLFSARCVDNLIISCKREKQSIVEKGKHDESRVDVMLQLERSQTGQVISNISSIMILQASPNVQDTDAAQTLSLPYIDSEESKNYANDNKVKIVEIEQDDDVNHHTQPSIESKDNYYIDEQSHEDSAFDTNDYPGSENELNTSKNYSCAESSESSDALRDIIDKKYKIQGDTLFNIVSPDELRLTMQRLNMQTALPEESADEMSLSTNTTSKKKSPTRVRIKSPYENKSYILEEKKRKKLLEIRDKREKRKQALGESCKVTKHKYGKSAIMPQPSSSVTKLSITNKSFYNSIYGQAISIENGKGSKGKGAEQKVPASKGLKRVSIPEMSFCEAEYEQDSPILTPDKNNKKYVNRSYYLDDTETEMMYIEMKTCESDDPKDCSASASAVSSEFHADLTLLSQLINSSTTDVHDKQETKSPCAKSQRLDAVVIPDESEVRNINICQSESNINVPHIAESISLDVTSNTKNTIVPSGSSIECRKSIEKIYELMNKLGKTDVVQIQNSKIRMNVHKSNVLGDQESSTFQASNSGTSLKHRITSSNPSCFSFENNNIKVPKENIVPNKGTETPIIPKVIINTKSQIPKIEHDKNKRGKRTVISPLKLPENPLKAISQFLHEIDNVQKVRQKIFDPKPNNKPDGVADARCLPRQTAFKRRSRFDQHIKDTEMVDRASKIPTPRRLRMETGRIPHQQIIVDDKNNRVPKRKVITDIIDEVKEARGEAVRGPSKFTSRLNTLAQPKRSYVQAHSEEFQTRYGKNLMADRLQRLASLPAPAAERSLGSPNSRNKLKRHSTDAVSAVSCKSPPLGKIERARRSASSSPEGKRQSPPPASKQNVPQTRDTIKKMVAVESYVKNHYGRAPASSELAPPARRSRAPLLPDDIELVSLTSANAAEESTELGSKLHRMVDTALHARAPPLAALAETPETASERGEHSESPAAADTHSRADERMSVDSDYPVDIFGDKNVVTAVENVDRKNLEETGKYELQPFNSLTEIEKLENALYRRLSVGTFQKKLRIKNLTLTPKQSVSQVFVVQGGDTGSIVVKSTISQKVKIMNSEGSLDLKAIPVFSSSHLDWTFADFPMQMATVGCAFPQYHTVRCEPGTKINSRNTVTSSNENVDELKIKSSTGLDKVSQCFKGSQLKLRVEQAAQVNALQDIATPIIPAAKQKEDNHENPEINETCKLSDAIITNENETHTFIDEQKDKSLVKTPDDAIDYTTSLDMLVGLLNEIQKITTCQTHITKAASTIPVKEMETILNDDATSEHRLTRNPLDIMSITSLEKLRKLESNPSIYTFYLSSDGEDESVNNSPVIFNDIMWKPDKTVCDKEVNVDIAKREYVNSFTEVPSIFPITLNHSTNVTNSLIGVLSQPSSQSMYSFVGHETLYSNTSLNPHKNIIQLAQIGIIENDLQQHFLVSCPDETKKKTEDIIKDASSVSTVCVEDEAENDHSLALNELTVENITITDMRRKNKADNLLVKKRYGSDCDPLLKIKREILVTVYSILVFTVFVALSFPQILYQV